MVRGLQPSALPPLREAYCASLNALLRRELRAVAASLRRSGPGGDNEKAGGSGKGGGSPGGASGLGPGSPLHSWRCEKHCRQCCNKHRHDETRVMQASSQAASAPASRCSRGSAVILVAILQKKKAISF